MDFVQCPDVSVSQCVNLLEIDRFLYHFECHRYLNHRSEKRESCVKPYFKEHPVSVDEYLFPFSTTEKNSYLKYPFQCSFTFWS